MAAKNREELLAIHDKEYAKLIKLLDGLNEDAASWSTVDDDTRVKDILAHRAHWIGLFFTWYEGGKNGKDVQTPAPGYKWNQLKPYNAMVREKYHDLAWPKVLAKLGEQHEKLRAFIEGENDAELYTRHIYPWLNNWTVGRWAEASGASAYRSAAKYIRKTVREHG
ncbi:MAG: ClbS/DfsB family four-helix bundle protein [Pseudomonadota bacterium]